MGYEAGICLDWVWDRCRQAAALTPSPHAREGHAEARTTLLGVSCGGGSLGVVTVCDGEKHTGGEGEDGWRCEGLASDNLRRRADKCSSTCGCGAPAERTTGNLAHLQFPTSPTGFKSVGYELSYPIPNPASYPILPMTSFLDHQTLYNCLRSSIAKQEIVQQACLHLHNKNQTFITED